MLYIAAALVFTVFGSLLAALAPLALKALVDALADAAPSEALVLYGATYLLALGGSRLLAEARQLAAGLAEQRLLARWTQRLFGHLLSLPMGWHQRQATGALAQSQQQASVGLQLMLSSVLAGLVPVLVELVTVAAVLWHLEQPRLVTVFAAAALAFAGVYWWGARGLQSPAGAVTQAHLAVGAKLTDGLLNVETIKCFGAEPAVQSVLQLKVRELERRWSALHGQRAAVGAMAAATLAVSMAATLFVAGQAFAWGTLTLGGFVLAHVYMLQMTRPLEMLGNAARNITQGLAFLRPALLQLQQAGEPAHESAPHPPLAACPQASSSPCISFRDVHFAYAPGQPVLQGLNLDIAPGTSVAIVGASGSGKSSLLRLLLGLHEPQAGHILFDGMPITEMPRSRLRRLVGLVSQDAALLDDTLAANIAFGQAAACRADIERAARLAGLHALGRALPQGLDSRLGERGARLSGGERQRVAIARLILRRPAVYALDEPTSMLDAETEAAVLHNLRTAATGCTTLVVAHRLCTVVHADEIVVLEAGRVVQRGSHAELLARGGAYARLWHGQYRAQPQAAAPRQATDTAAQQAPTGAGAGC